MAPSYCGRNRGMVRVLDWAQEWVQERVPALAKAPGGASRQGLWVWTSTSPVSASRYSDTGSAANCNQDKNNNAIQAVEAGASAQTLAGGNFPACAGNRSECRDPGAVVPLEPLLLRPAPRGATAPRLRGLVQGTQGAPLGVRPQTEGD